MDTIPFWHLSSDEILSKLHSSPNGLSEGEAAQRLAAAGPNVLYEKRKTSALVLFLTQFKSPLILLLIAAALLAFFLGDHTEAILIMIIVLFSGFLGFFQERGAIHAVEKLLSIVRIQTLVLREGQEKKVDLEKVVPGDIVILRGGDVVPGDCYILECKDCSIDEATLTGETFHVEKQPGQLPENTPLAKRTNILYMGSHVVSGRVKALVVNTGKTTEFGKISENLQKKPPQTAFEKGVYQFGYLLMEVTLVLVMTIFAFNVYLQRPVLESFMFALALAVGLTPQLLPAIISVNLSHGAKRMAHAKVIVKKLSSIENFGSMNILCSDKTGTLTTGVIQVDGYLDAEGKDSEEVFEYTYINASFQAGYQNPIDEAIINSRKMDLSAWKKIDEIPYDFVRKKLTVLARGKEGKQLISKGAFSNMLAICSSLKKGGEILPLASFKDQLEKEFNEYSQKGFRVLAVAFRSFDKESVTREDEKEMTFVGFLLLSDPPKVKVLETIQKLKEAGVSLKVVTGDNRFVTAHTADLIGMKDYQLITGSEIEKLNAEQLEKVVVEKNIFAEVEPNQKERIILALRKVGNVVGYLGDGVNDATALHAADVSISVDSGADVTKEVADIVLLKKDLSVIWHGVQEGRKTFANTLKYIFMATSANFGNMFSMAGVSLLINFLPLLPTQILLTNVLTDVPEMTIANDRVDPELLVKPVQWNLGFIKRFMIVFGLISSIFDFITFGVLLHFLKATPELFRTGWFLESVASAAAIVLIIRTRKPFYKSRPSGYLTTAVLAAIAFTMLLPYTPLGPIFEFVAMPLSFYGAIAIIVLLYILMVEIAKKIFYRLEAKRLK